MRNFRFIVVALSLALPAVTALSPATVLAVTGQAGGQQITINPGGGILSDGTDGLRFTVNSAADAASNYDQAQPGQDGVVYRATRQYCCGAGAPILNIGGTLYGQAAIAGGGGVATWSSIQVVSSSGAVSVGSRTGTTGSGSATVRYTAVKGGLTYTFDRALSYTYPNDYITESYTFTIPTGNTDNVKFYLGGDTAPGSSDQGYGIMLTSPVRSIISLNTSSHIMFGFREVQGAGARTFDGATSQQYSAPYTAVSLGNNIGYVVTASNHDAGLMMQWNLGSTPGTQTGTLQEFATQQGTNLNAGFSAPTTEAGSAVQLNLSVVNTQLTTTSGLAYTATLPSGLVVGTGSSTNACSGTLTATAGGNTISLASGSVGAATNCVMSVPVVASSAAAYTISSASISGLSNLTNNVGTSSLTVVDDNDGDGITNAVEAAAPNSGDANNDGTPDKDQLNVTSFVNSVTGQYSVLEANNACELTSVSAHAESTATGDTGYSYPLGLLDFTADCGTPGYTTTITQYFFDPPAGNFILRKLVSGSYRTISGATITNATIGGRSALQVSYQVTDGGALDDDGATNGVIVDPAGPAVLAASTPTPGVAAPSTGLLPHSALVPTAAVLGGISLLWVAIRRRSSYELHS